MTKPILLTLTLAALLSAAPPDPPDVQADVPPADAPPLVPETLLREATARAKGVDEPWNLFEEIALAGLWQEESAALRTLEVVAEGVAETYEQQPARDARSRWARLAEIAAPLDPAVRDRYLRRAVKEADAALAEPELWRIPPGPRYFPGPETAAEKQRPLVFSRSLWKALLEPRGERRAKRLIDLLHQTERAGYFPSDVLVTYKEQYLRQWARLDPPSFLAIAPTKVRHSELAPLAMQVAQDLTRSHGYTDFTKSLIDWAADKYEMGRHESDLRQQYELRERWDEAWTRPPGETRTALLEAVIRERVYNQGGPLSAAHEAYRWASEAADPALRERLQKTAEATGRVNDRFRRAIKPRPQLTDSERQEIRANADPAVVRILERPDDLDWLTDEPDVRDQALYQAAEIAWRENEDWESVQPIHNAVSTQEMRDVLLFHLAFQDWPPAVKLLRRIEGDRLWIGGATRTAELVASRRRRGER